MMFILMLWVAFCEKVDLEVRMRRMLTGIDQVYEPAVCYDPEGESDDENDYDPLR